MDPITIIIIGVGIKALKESFGNKETSDAGSNKPNATADSNIGEEPNNDTNQPDRGKGNTKAGEQPTAGKPSGNKANVPNFAKGSEQNRPEDGSDPGGGIGALANNTEDGELKSKKSQQAQREKNEKN